MADPMELFHMHQVTLSATGPDRWAEQPKIHGNRNLFFYKVGFYHLYMEL